MDSKTLAALKGSIKKWEGIVAGKISDEGQDNCPLCQMFFKGRCHGCPVGDCNESPYYDWFYATLKIDPPFFANTPELHRLAQAELDFLRSLLPDEEK